MRIFRYILPTIIAGALSACSDNAPDCSHGNCNQPKGDIFITVDLSQPASRLSYDFVKGSGLTGSGDIRVTWNLGDIIKVYETTLYGTAGCHTLTFDDYADYADDYPYPAAPETDVFYRFECVGGEGTARGVFKYLGLASTKIVEVNGTHNVDVDIKYDHEINNWSRFQGLAIFGNPLRNHMMRTQSAPNDMSHLKYGQRMYGYVCAHNFQWYDENTSYTEGVGLDQIIFRNVESCIYRVLIGGIDVPVYGGSTLSLTMPGVTDQSGLCGSPMTLTLGNPDDHVIGNDPWCLADPDKEHINDSRYAFAAYIVGWPGTLPAGQDAVVTLHEHVSGRDFTWHLTADSDKVFAECEHYTFDLRDKIR